MGKRILFLDIDGVLNCADFIFAKHPQSVSSPNYPPEKRECFDPLAIERLNRITDATGAVIVVSSSWRTGYPDIEDTEVCTAPMSTVTTAGEPATIRCRDCKGCQDATLQILREFLVPRGVKAEMIGITPFLSGEPRGMEIQAWLDENHHDVDGYVILDDTDDCQTEMVSRISNEELKEITRIAYEKLGLKLCDEFEAYGRDHLVLTSWGTGLLDHHVPRAVEILLRPLRSRPDVID